MPKVALYNMKGEQVGDIDLKDEVFGIDVNEHVIHMAVVNQLANQRQGTQSTKTRSEVSGGGSKPWRQKGTGRARHGSIRSPIWTKGGVAHGPKPRDFASKLPKKVRRLAIKSALSSKVLDNDIIVLDELKFDKIRTKNMIEVLNNLQVKEKVLVVLPEKDDIVYKSSRNIPDVKTTLVNALNAYDILKYGKFLITRDAVERVEEVYG